MAVKWEWLLSLEEEEDSGAESRLPGNVRGDPSVSSVSRERQHASKEAVGLLS